MDHRLGLQVTYIRTRETTEHGPVPGGDYKTRWQAMAVASCPWFRLKKAIEKMTVKPSKHLKTAVWWGAQKFEGSCSGIQFQTSYLIRQASCLGYPQTGYSISLVDRNEMSASIHVWTTPTCQRQQWAVGFPWMETEIIQSDFVTNCGVTVSDRMIFKISNSF